MRRLFLIDPWLTDARGHNYQYALDLTDAGQKAGYEPIVAIRKRIAKGLAFPQSLQVEKVFKHGECSRHWISLDGRSHHPYDVEGNWLPDDRIRWWEKWLDLPARLDRARRIASFQRGCEELFRRHSPTTSDLLYLPSLSEFDFLSAVRFWRDNGWTKEFDWHLQFHFNFLFGRDWEFEQQSDRLQRMQQLFRAAVDQVPQHRLHFYTTSPAIARQYDALGIAIFRPLAYPVRPLNRDKENLGQSERPSRLRVTFPGAMRREKGKKQIGKLVTGLWPELQSGKIQLAFQAKPKQIASWLPRALRKQLTTIGEMSDRHTAIAAAPHPLSSQQYENFVRSTDIGLFAYDGRRYFSRVSGILCEMLSAGIPVVVPAGCWLAEQIDQQNYHYVGQLWKRHKAEFPVLRADQNADLVLPFEACCGLLRFSWPKDLTPGTFVECTAVGQTPTSSSQEKSDEMRHRQILSTPESGLVGMVTRFSHPAAKWRVTLKKAYEDAPLCVRDIEVLPIRHSPSGTSMPTTVKLPYGSIGVTATGGDQYRMLLQEMIEHYSHYASNALRYAKEWQWKHDPQLTVKELELRQFDRMHQRPHAA